jgi:mannose-6-phosphate isomerase-like protein (cupin superfamily)
LIEESDLAAAEVHHVKIQDAKLHYHKKTDEIYYIIDGEGKLVLDDEEVAVKKGVVVYVPRGVKHKAVGDLTVLTVCIPRGVLDDVHEVE